VRATELRAVVLQVVVERADMRLNVITPPYHDSGSTQPASLAAAHTRLQVYDAVELSRPRGYERDTRTGKLCLHSRWDQCTIKASCQRAHHGAAVVMLLGGRSRVCAPRRCARVEQRRWRSRGHTSTAQWR
jgi:hypothetical protein